LKIRRSLQTTSTIAVQGFRLRRAITRWLSDLSLRLKLQAPAD
jgi:hypothetical protein